MMTVDSYRKMATSLRRTISYARFAELKQTAKTTVGNDDHMPWKDTFVITTKKESR